MCNDFCLTLPKKCEKICDNRRFWARGWLNLINVVVFLAEKVYNMICKEKMEGNDNMLDKTMTFSVHEDRENEMKEILMTVYDALKQKGYNPINQLVGYILSEDPTYITTFNNARGLIRHIDRDELLQVLVKSYLSD